MARYRLPTVFLIAAFLLPSCRTPVGCFDEDQDGLCSPDDCDDQDPTIQTGSDETCDGIDNDCDGEIDEGMGSIAWQDSDGDGFGDPDHTLLSCTMPAGYTDRAGDCDDGDASIHPDADDTCGDSVDSDCDGDDPACDPGGDYDLAEADVKLRGEGNGDRLGNEHVFGDVNDDGIDDLWVGARERTEDYSCNGKSYLVYGPITADGAIADADASLVGEASEYEIGRGVALDDFDGDGYDDVAAGAPHGPNNFAGGAFILFGPVSGERSTSDADVRILGDTPGGHTGHGLSSGDFNGDGFGDLAIGTYFSSVGAQNGGAAEVIYGPIPRGNIGLADADAEFAGLDQGVGVGEFMFAGEVTGDGLDDVFAVATLGSVGPPQSGVVYVWAGPMSGANTTDDAVATFSGDSANAYAGCGVAAGDVDGDGYGDLLVGGNGASANGPASGAAWLVHGPVSGIHNLSSADARAVGEGQGSQAGWSVAVGEADDDAYADVLVGAIGESSVRNAAGAAYLIYGPMTGNTTLADADARFLGADDTGYVGSSVGFGDISGDGVNDVGIGAEYAPDGRIQPGAIYLMYGGAL